MQNAPFSFFGTVGTAATWPMKLFQRGPILMYRDVTLTVISIHNEHRVGSDGLQHLHRSQPHVDAAR